MGPHPAVAAVRLAVRRALADVTPADVAPADVAPAAGPPDVASAAGPVLVACSGGADSLALLAATVFETRRTGVRVIGVTVDHGLQPGSAEHAEAVVKQMAAIGADETATATVRVDPGGRGIEAAAREARYAALEQLADHFGGRVVLLGHTLDDQAETVLLGLTRGSGGRSIAGMRTGFGPFRRPLLGITRAETEAACAAEGLDAWQDPHNEDPRFTRARIRHRVMPMLEAELGPGVAATLARTADQLREDMETLDDLADALHEAARTPTGLDLAALQAQPAALRRRVLRLAAVAAGSTPSELFRVHVLAMDELVVAYRGQLRVELPGHVSVVRRNGELRFERTGPARRTGQDPVAG
ncbi:MAG: tRNA lysidine(34) synthetase TilS [Actinomycetota bacterium]